MEFLLRRPGQIKNCFHCNFQDFHSLSKENQVSLVRAFLSDPGSESWNGQTWGLGGGKWSWEERERERGGLLLCLLSRNILGFVFPYLPGNFALKNGGDFWWIFSGLRFTRNEARKLLKRFGENSEREIRGKIRDKISKNSGNFRSATFLT